MSLFLISKLWLAKVFAQAISEDEGLRQGVTTYQGYLTSLPVAQGLDKVHTPIDELV